MKIEFLKDRGCYRTGQVVIHPAPGVAEMLVLRGIARLAEKPKPQAAKQPKGRR